MADAPDAGTAARRLAEQVREACIHEALRAYEDAGVAPESVGLVEAHGTGIPLGDITEVRALSKVFGPRPGKVATCGVGSVKSMIGHTLAAAGVAGFIKAALALHHQQIPPSLHAHPLNPHLRLDESPFRVPGRLEPWPGDAGTALSDALSKATSWETVPGTVPRTVTYPSKHPSYHSGERDRNGWRKSVAERSV